MAQSIPQLDVFYIDFSKDKVKKTKANIAVSAVIPVAAGIASTTALALLLTPVVVGVVKDLINNNRFYIITSEEELNSFVNPNGNAWKTNEKSLRIKQYYIRHPKASKENVLIEAGDFFEYIEDEQIEELVHFVRAHCDASEICIERTEISHTSGEISENIEATDISADAEYKKGKHICVRISNPNGFPREQPRERYEWIEDSVIQGIKCLSNGSIFEKSYNRDFTFGVSAKAAETIGLKLDMHKNYCYKIYVKTVERTQSLPQSEELSELQMRVDKIEQEKKSLNNKPWVKIAIATLLGIGVVAALLLAILL